MNERVFKGSQEDYYRGCILVPGCNVLLKEGESCWTNYEAWKVTSVYGPPGYQVTSNLYEER